MSVASPLDRYLSSLRASVGDRPVVEVLAALTEVLSDGEVALRDPQGEPISVTGLHGLVVPPDDCRDASLLGIVHEALLAPVSRRDRGAHYTPPPVARDLVAFVRRAAPMRDGGRWCDPACGGGAFLLAAADSIVQHERVAPVDAARRVWGGDVDALAVSVARAAVEVWARRPIPELVHQLVVGDVLDDAAAVWPSDASRFDVIVGNPPFLSPLRRRNASAAWRGTRRAGAEVVAAPYVDTAARFLAVALDLVRDVGGVVAMIQPQSTLSSRDAAPVRAEVLGRGGLAGLWFARDAVFPSAAVAVCAPVVATGHRPPLVARATDADVLEASPVAPPAHGVPWSTLVVDLLDVPPLPPPTGRTLRDLGATATAGFRDEFYGLAAATRDAVGSDVDIDVDALRVVTVGAIDVLGHGWGRRPIRLGGRRFERPVVRPADAPPRVAAWLAARRGPKVLVATQTNVLEVVVDAAGDLVGCTPVVEVRVPAELCWLVAAALSAPVTSGWALAMGAGSARSVRALKLSARQILDVPLPPSGDPHWVEAAERAEAIAAARAAGDVVAIEQWSAFGVAACRAYGADPDAWVPWWLGRQNALTPQAAPC